MRRDVFSSPHSLKQLRSNFLTWYRFLFSGVVLRRRSFPGHRRFAPWLRLRLRFRLWLRKLRSLCQFLPLTVDQYLSIHKLLTGRSNHGDIAILTLTITQQSPGSQPYNAAAISILLISDILHLPFVGPLRSLDILTAVPIAPTLY